MPCRANPSYCTGPISGSTLWPQACNAPEKPLQRCEQEAHTPQLQSSSDLALSRNNPPGVCTLTAEATATCTQQAVNVARINSGRAPECPPDTASHMDCPCTQPGAPGGLECAVGSCHPEAQGPGRGALTRWDSWPRALLRPQLSASPPLETILCQTVASFFKKQKQKNRKPAQR